jgi:hypothetical protein
LEWSPVTLSSLEPHNQSGGSAKNFQGLAKNNGENNFKAAKKNGNGNHVPDAGSTVTLLAMALLGVGFIRHRI